MLSVVIAFVLSQTPVADKPAVIIHDVTPKANCPSNTVLEASNPAIARPQIGGGPRNGFPDMVHMPSVDFIYALDQRVNGCFTPKFVNGPRTFVGPLKPVEPSSPGVR